MFPWYLISDLHFNGTISSTAHNLIRDEVNTIHLVSMTRQISFELVCFQIPYLWVTVINGCKGM